MQRHAWPMISFGPIVSNVSIMMHVSCLNNLQPNMRSVKTPLDSGIGGDPP